MSEVDSKTEKTNSMQEISSKEAIEERKARLIQQMIEEYQLQLEEKEKELLRATEEEYDLEKNEEVPTVIDKDDRVQQSVDNVSRKTGDVSEEQVRASVTSLSSGQRLQSDIDEKTDTLDEETLRSKISSFYEESRIVEKVPLEEESKDLITMLMTPSEPPTLIKSELLTKDSFQTRLKSLDHYLDSRSDEMTSKLTCTKTTSLEEEQSETLLEHYAEINQSFVFFHGFDMAKIMENIPLPAAANGIEMNAENQDLRKSSSRTGTVGFKERQSKLAQLQNIIDETKEENHDKRETLKESREKCSRPTRWDETRAAVTKASVESRAVDFNAELREIERQHLKSYRNWKELKERLHALLRKKDESEDTVLLYGFVELGKFPKIDCQIQCMDYGQTTLGNMFVLSYYDTKLKQFFISAAGYNILNEKVIVLRRQTIQKFKRLLLVQKLGIIIGVTDTENSNENFL